MVQIAKTQKIKKINKVKFSYEDSHDSVNFFSHCVLEFQILNFIDFSQRVSHVLLFMHINVVFYMVNKGHNN